MRLLLVEDEPLIGVALQQGLKQDGFTTDWVQNYAYARSAVESVSYDLIVLDLGLPDKDGLALLKYIRQDEENPIPIIISTARSDIKSRVEGLDLGADDYLVKPFALVELVARIHAVLRRQKGRSNTELMVGNLRLDPSKHLFWFNNEPILLSVKEFEILHILMSDPEKVVSKEKLEESLYGWDEEISSNAVEVHIHKLRKKMTPSVIKTIRGVGYHLGQLS